MLVLSALVRPREVLTVLTMLVGPSVAPTHIALILIPVHVITLVVLPHILVPILKVPLRIVAAEIPVVTVAEIVSMTTPVIPRVLVTHVMVAILIPITRLVVVVLVVWPIVRLGLIEPEAIRPLPVHATLRTVVVVLAPLIVVHSSTHLTMTRVLGMLDFDLPVRIERRSLVHFFDGLIGFLRLREHDVRKALGMVSVAVFDDVHRLD